MRDRFFELSTDMLCRASLAGWFLEVNPAWTRTLGHSAETLTSRPFVDFVHPEDRERTAQETAALAEPGFDTVNFQNRYRHADGSYRWLSWSAASDVELGEIFAVARDITESRLAHERLAAALEAAQAANKAKSAFLANMSHELRTPLNSVIGFTNLLLRNKEGRLDARELGFLERIRGGGRHLLSLINDVLDLAKIEAGRTELRIEPVDVNRLVREVCEQLSAEAQAKGLALRAEGALEAAWVQADPQRLTQTLLNLVGNAVKFTSSGAIEVRVIGGAGEAPERLDVVDSGPGIAAEDVPSIFDEFQQLDGSTARSFGGTGLGLPISRRLCRLMGFDLVASSEPGVGSTFSILFGAQEPPPHVALGVPPPARRKPLVLVVDDDPEARALLSNALQRQHCEVIAVESGRRGLELARSVSPDLITLDLRMPGLDGWCVAEAIRREPALAGTPILLSSVLSGDEGLGGVFSLGKPLDAEVLGALIERHFDASQRRVLVLAESARRIGLAARARGLGAEVVEASTPREALGLIDVEAPRLVLLDLALAEGAGYDFLERLRADPRHRHLPVLVLAPSDLEESTVCELARQANGLLRCDQPLEPAIRRALGWPAVE